MAPSSATGASAATRGGLECRDAPGVRKGDMKNEFGQFLWLLGVLLGLAAVAWLACAP